MILCRQKNCLYHYKPGVCVKIDLFLAASNIGAICQSYSVVTGKISLTRKHYVRLEFETGDGGQLPRSRLP